MALSRVKMSAKDACINHLRRAVRRMLSDCRIVLTLERSASVQRSLNNRETSGRPKLTTKRYLKASSSLRKVRLKQCQRSKSQIHHPIKTRSLISLEKIATLIKSTWNLRANLRSQLVRKLHQRHPKVAPEKLLIKSVTD